MAVRLSISAAALLIIIGCATDDVVTPALLTPVIQGSAAAQNPNNVLSAIVTARVRLADSVRVHFGLENESLTNVTPAVLVTSDSAVIPVLGLLPDTRYVLQVVAFGGGGQALSAQHALKTGPIPPDIPVYVAGGSNPSPGYIAFSTGQYGIVLDNAGRVVWYYRFNSNQVLNFQPEPTGRYVARPPISDGGVWIEIDVLGNVTRTLGCAGGLLSRLHDLIVQTDGSYWIMCDETRTLDLSHVGANAGARVTGTVVQHISGTGNLSFQWSPFDHFDIGVFDAAEIAANTGNWTHGNALDLDADSNLLVSFRNLSEVTKIDTRNGQVLWRMGGWHNQFTFENSSVTPFAHQHGLRVASPGSLLLLDNLGDPTGSRAKRYAYNEATRTARLVASYGSDPQVVAQLGGATQDLPGGHTLVSFGNGGRVEEYDATSRVVWRIEGTPGYIFRAVRIRSLYTPGVGGGR